MLLTGHDHDLAIGYDGKTVMVESNEEGNFVTAIDFVDDRYGRGQATARSPGRRRFRVHDSSTVDPDPEVARGGASATRARSRRSSTSRSATTATELDSRSTPIVRSQEAAIGNLIADAIRASTGADVAITNGGGIRANKQYPPGAKLTRRDILTELPFGNTTSWSSSPAPTCGRRWRTASRSCESRAGRFPQVSGLKVEVDAQARRPAPA